MKGQGEEEEEQKKGRKGKYTLWMTVKLFLASGSLLEVCSLKMKPLVVAQKLPLQNTHAHAHCFSHWQLQPGMG